MEMCVSQTYFQTETIYGNVCFPTLTQNRNSLWKRVKETILEHVFPKFIYKQNQQTDVSSRIRTSTNRTNIQMAWSDKEFYKQNQQTDVLSQIRSSTNRTNKQIFLPQ